MPSSIVLVSGVAAYEGTNIFVSVHEILIPSIQPIYSSSFKRLLLTAFTNIIRSPKISGDFGFYGFAAEQNGFT